MEIFGCLFDRLERCEIQLNEAHVATWYSVFDLLDCSVGLGWRPCGEEDLFGVVLRELQNSFLAQSSVAFEKV